MTGGGDFSKGVFTALKYVGYALIFVTKMAESIGEFFGSASVFSYTKLEYIMGRNPFLSIVIGTLTVVLIIVTLVFCIKAMKRIICALLFLVFAVATLTILGFVILFGWRRLDKGEYSSMIL